MENDTGNLTFGDLKVGDIFHCNLHLEDFSYVYTKSGDEKCRPNGYIQESIYHRRPKEDAPELGIYKSSVVKTVIIL